MILIKKLFLKIKQLRCEHVYIDLRKIGYERCVYCQKERKKIYE